MTVPIDKPERWTIETLRSYLEALGAERDARYQQRFVAAELAVKDALVAQKEAISAALAAADRAVSKAETAAEKRFESVNEFRATLRDQQAELMPRLEASVMFRSIADKLDVLTARIDKGDGSTKGINSAWSVLIGVAGLAVLALGVIVAFFRVGH